MRIVRIVSVLVAGAFVALCWLATGASAEILDPAAPYTPYQPDSKTGHFMPPTQTSGATGSASPQRPTAPTLESSTPTQANPSAATTPAAAPTPPKPTIAPEPVVMRAQRSPMTAPAEISNEASSAVPVASGTPGPLQDVKSFLARVAKACQVGVASVAGGPAAPLAVLATFLMAMSILAQVGHRIRNEAANELLYSAVVIAPG